MHSPYLVAKLPPTLGDFMDFLARQASLSVGFSRQEYQSVLPFPSPLFIACNEIESNEYISSEDLVIGGG